MQIHFPISVKANTRIRINFAFDILARICAISLFILFEFPEGGRWQNELPAYTPTLPASKRKQSSAVATEYKLMHISTLRTHALYAGWLQTKRATTRNDKKLWLVYSLVRIHQTSVGYSLPVSGSCQRNLLFSIISVVNNGSSKL